MKFTHRLKSGYSDNTSHGNVWPAGRKTRLSLVHALKIYCGLAPLGLDHRQLLSLDIVQCDRFLAQGATVALTFAFAGVFMPLCILGHPLDHVGIIWYGFDVLALLAMVVLARRCRSRVLPTADARTVRLVTMVAGLLFILTGLNWGLFVYVFLPAATLFQLVVLSATTAAFACAPAFALSVRPMTSLAYVYAVFVPFSVALSNFPGAEIWLLCLGMVFLFPACGLVIMRGYSVFLESELLRLDREKQSETITLLLREFEDASSDWLWETDARGCLVRAPYRMEEAAGRLPGSLKGTGLLDLFDPADHDDGIDGIETIRAAFVSQIPFAEAVIRVAGKNDLSWWSMTARPIIDRNGAFSGFRGVGSDVTDRIRITQELSRARDSAQTSLIARSRFIATMSHELRTPLNAIIGFAELIADARLGPEAKDEYREFASEIRESGTHLLAMINDILETSALDEGVPVLAEHDIHVEDTLRGAMRMVQGRCAERGIILSQEVMDTCVIHADERRVRQILINLLSNATKFARHRIMVSIESTDNFGCDFIVVDDGPGPPDEGTDTLFKPFIRGTPEERITEVGLGLGLSIARTLARAHGGDVSLERGPDGGAKAVFTMPPGRVRWIDCEHRSA